MFEEFITHRVKIVSLDGREFSGAIFEVEGDFIKLREAGNTYIINTKYIGYLKTDYVKQPYQHEDQNVEMFPAAGYQYPARVAAKVTPRSNEFSMELPTPEDTVPGNTLGGPQLVRETHRRVSRNAIPEDGEYRSRK